MGFTRQDDWSGLPFPPSGDLPNPGTEQQQTVAFLYFKKKWLSMHGKDVTSKTVTPVTEKSKVESQVCSMLPFNTNGKQRKGMCVCACLSLHRIPLEE